MTLLEFYESDEYFATLLRLNETEGSGERRQRALVEVLGEARKGLRVLDVGCGLGGFSSCLAGENEITGIDLNPKCLKYNADSRGYRSIRVDIARPWNLGEERFDLILCGDVLEHVFDPVSVLREAVAVLKDDGRLVVSVPNVGYLAKRARLLFKGELSDELLDEHIRFFSRRLITRVMETAGLKVKKVVPYSWKEGRVWYERLPPQNLFAWGFVLLSTKA